MNKYLLLNLIQNQHTNRSSFELDRSSNKIFTSRSFLSSEKWFTDKHSSGWTRFYTFLSLVFPPPRISISLLPSSFRFTSSFKKKNSLSLEPQALLSPSFFLSASAMPCIISKINSLDGLSFVFSFLLYPALTVEKLWREAGGRDETYYPPYFVTSLYFISLLTRPLRILGH